MEHGIADYETSQLSSILQNSGAFDRAFDTANVASSRSDFARRNPTTAIRRSSSLQDAPFAPVRGFEFLKPEYQQIFGQTVGQNVNGNGYQPTHHQEQNPRRDLLSGSIAGLPLDLASQSNNPRTPLPETLWPNTRVRKPDNESIPEPFINPLPRRDLLFVLPLAADTETCSKLRRLAIDEAVEVDQLGAELKQKDLSIRNTMKELNDRMEATSAVHRQEIHNIETRYQSVVTKLQKANGSEIPNLKEELARTHTAHRARVEALEAEHRIAVERLKTQLEEGEKKIEDLTKRQSEFENLNTVRKPDYSSFKERLHSFDEGFYARPGLREAAWKLATVGFFAAPRVHLDEAAGDDCVCCYACSARPFHWVQDKLVDERFLDAIHRNWCPLYKELVAEEEADGRAEDPNRLEANDGHTRSSYFKRMGKFFVRV